LKGYMQEDVGSIPSNPTSMGEFRKGVSRFKSPQNKSISVIKA